MDTPIVLAKYRAGDDWIYEPEKCPGCQGTGKVLMTFGDPRRPWISEEGEVDCGLCGGTGELFEDGQYDREAARALWLQANGRVEELEQLTTKATLKLDELRREMW